MRETNSESDPNRPACADAILALQQFMDGIVPDQSPAVVLHRESCQDCRDEWQLARLISQRPPEAVVVPSSLVSKLEKAVSRDRKRQRYQRWAAWSMLPVAAVVLVSLLRPSQRTPFPVELPEQSVAKLTVPESKTDNVVFHKSLSDARSAVLALSVKVVPERPEVTITLPKVDPMAAAEPAWDRLTDAGDGLKTGVKPLATSARRAVTMLFKATETLSFADTSRKNRP